MTEPDLLTGMRSLDDDIAIPATSFARVVEFVMSQPDEVNVNEVLFRPTRQEL